MKPRDPLTLALLAPLLLSACLSIPANPEKMTPEQLREWAKDKNANIACSTASNIYGRGIVSYVVIDKGTLQTSAVSVDGECKITIQNDTTKQR
jgi:starvation-inducible outer membrane lipoprotein